MKIEVKVVARGRRLSALLTDEHAISSHGFPVVVIRGEGYRPDELARGFGRGVVEVAWPPHKPRRGPAWRLVQGAQRAGYPIQV